MKKNEDKLKFDQFSTVCRKNKEYIVRNAQRSVETIGYLCGFVCVDFNSTSKTKSVGYLNTVLGVMLDFFKLIIL